jgi:redox-sensitive bicupin YhaK (pirin superfamily)
MTASSPVLSVRPLGFPWETADPFLFCVYHDDSYPRGNAQMGPDASLAGRSIGQDFSRRDGWSMYHGQTVPGFPAHPHRGFETVTILRKGFIDHSDSLGAIARFGSGDVQWLTAGRGIVHSEMFPLLDREQENPLELFQIWLNSPSKSKMAEPHFTMLWNEHMPRRILRDGQGRKVEVTVVAGRFGDAVPLNPPPDSWAAQADADVAIWTVRMEAGSSWTVPAAARGTSRRHLYFFKGDAALVAGQSVRAPMAIELRPDALVALQAGDSDCEFLLLQGKPIGEPVVQHGPYVMNTQEEIRQTIKDHGATGFGGWSFTDRAPVHGHEPKRFARYPNGRTEAPLDPRRCATAGS